jgi:ornithine cyclodeaminase
MTKLITCQHVAQMVEFLSLEVIIKELAVLIEQDMCNWNEFEKVTRPAFQSNSGVIELMPISNSQYFACKTVNGHPRNSKNGKMCVVATGQLNNIHDGYPVMIAEMTILTALRTAVTSAIATKYLASRHESITIIGCGAQSEFLISAHLALFDVEVVYYYDTDSYAMNKFNHNLQDSGPILMPLRNASDSIFDSDIIITCIAEKSKVKLFDPRLVKPGTHINAIGGDCPGKTELDPNLLNRSKVVVEYIPQTLVEGEIQNYIGPVDEIVAAELWEVITGNKIVRTSPEDITLFDGVGFALEDYTILNYIHHLSDRLGVYDKIEIIPDSITNPKNLFGYMKGNSTKQSI